jgi:hypothetical protein
MKVPKYIEQALNKRVKGACMVMESDRIITNFIEKYGIVCDFEDYCGGVEIYSNPYDSAERILEAIRQKT